MTPTPLDDNTRLDIAQYTLGTLYGDQERQIRELINNNDEAGQLALHWETVLLALADRLPPVAPEPLVLVRIQRTLGLPRIDPEVQPLSRPETPLTQAIAKAPAPIRPTPAQTPVITDNEGAVLTQADSVKSSDERQAREPSVKPWYQHSMIWLALMAAVVTTFSVYFVLKPGTPNNKTAALDLAEITPKPPETLFIAVLQPPRSSSSPAWLVLKKSDRELVLEPRLKSELAPNQAMALWTRQPSQPATQFLGWLDDSQVNQVVVPDNIVISDGQLFEITLEKQGKNTNTPPEGAILFIGQAITATLPDPTPAAPEAPAQ